MNDDFRTTTHNAEESPGGNLLRSLLEALSHDFTMEQASSILTAIMICEVCSDAVKDYWNTNRDNIVSIIEEMKTEDDIEGD